MYSPPDQIVAVIASIRRRLGDPIPGGVSITGAAEPLWTNDEIHGYFRDGLEELTRVTGILWDKETLDDIPPICNYEFDFERAFATARRIARFDFIGHEIHILGNRHECNFPWEAKYGSSSQHTLGEIEFAWERDEAPAGSLHQSATVTLPEGATQVERVTWNDHKIPPVRSSELEHYDTQYETIPGQVQAYSQDKDGLDVLRKYQIPAAVAPVLSVLGAAGIPRGVMDLEPGAPIHHMHMDEWGMVFGGVLDSAPYGVSVYGDFIPIAFDAARAHLATWTKPPSPFTDSTVIGTGGFLRRLPGYHPARGIYGIVRHIAPTTRNTAVEYQRTPIPCEQGFDRPQLPAFMLLYPRHYALWKCLSRKGAGQNLKLAAHYKLRWQQALSLTQVRLDRVQSQVIHGLGPQGHMTSKPPLARPPSDLDYGQMNRY